MVTETITGLEKADPTGSVDNAGFGIGSFTLSRDALPFPKTGAHAAGHGFTVPSPDDLVSWLARPTICALPATPDWVRLAGGVALSMWRLRAAERGYSEPADLSGSCKFTSIFARILFGGELSGNEYHQFVETDKGIIDLNRSAGDVCRLIEAGRDPWRHDPDFWGNPDHMESMRSCLPRLHSWVAAFEIHAASVGFEGWPSRICGSTLSSSPCPAETPPGISFPPA